MRGGERPQRDLVAAVRGPPRPQDLEGVDAVVNLAGAGIGDRKWTDERKKVIVEQPRRRPRRRSPRRCAEARAEAQGVPLGFGGRLLRLRRRRRRDIDESAPRGTRFPRRLVEAVGGGHECAAESAGIRLVHLRTGIVLSTAGGLLAEAAPAVQARRRRPAGKSGSSILSWISLADEVAPAISLPHRRRRRRPGQPHRTRAGHEPRVHQGPRPDAAPTDPPPDPRASAQGAVRQRDREGDPAGRPLRRTRRS